MNCKTVDSITQDYLDGRLATLDRNEFVRHVNMCADCEEKVLAYREMFAALGDIGRHECPASVGNSVILQLKHEGYIYEPRMSPLRKAGHIFMSWPAGIRFPLAAAFVVAVLYIPIAALLGLARGSVSTATGAMTSAFLFLRDALGSVDYIARFLDGLNAYGRAAKTVITAFASLLTGEGLWVLGAGCAIVAAAILVVMVLKRKRGSGDATHATFSF